MKSLKVIYKEDTKRAAKIPTSYSQLYEMIPTLYPGENLTKYLLKYKDSDNDFVSMSTEQDFKLMLESCDGAIKIYVIPQDLEKSFDSLDESIQIIDKTTDVPVNKEPQSTAKPEETNVNPTEEESKEEKERAVKREIYEQLNKLRDEKDQISYKIREVRSKITEIKNEQQEDFQAHPDVKAQRRQERQELQKQNDDMGKIKHGLIKQIVVLQEKLRKMRKPRERNPEDEIDFDNLNKERVDEIVKEVLIDLLPVISRKVLNRIKREFQPNKKISFDEEEKRTVSKPERSKEIIETMLTSEVEKLINNVPLTAPVPVVSEMKKESPIVSRFNMSYEQPIIIPKQILPGEEKIWVTIEVKNTGSARWPKGSKLYYVRGLEAGDKLYVPELYPADHQKITLMFENPKAAGNFESVWKLGCEDSANSIEYVDKEIVIKIQVKEPKAKKGKPEKAAEPAPIMPPAPAKAEVSDKALQDALKLQEAFPALSLDQLLKVIRENPNASMEEYVNTLLQLTQ